MEIKIKPFVVTITLNPALDKTIILDQLKIGNKNYIKNLTTNPGGNGINIAKTLKEFDIDSVVTGFNAGENGEILLDLMYKEKIDMQFMEIPGETKINLKIIEWGKNSITEINEHGFYVSYDDVNKFMMKLSKLLEKANFLVLSGNLPLGISDDIYFDIINMANKKKIKTILNAEGSAFNNGIKASPYSIKLNTSKLEILCGRRFFKMKDIIKSVKNIMKRNNIKIVIMSMYKVGVLIINEDKIIKTKTLPIIPVSNDAKSDSMIAAFIYSIFNDCSLEETAKIITSAEIITALKSGSRICTKKEVIEFNDHVEIERIL
ncbi:MAG: hexose kinase [Clostridiales bacterium]